MTPVLTLTPAAWEEVYRAFVNPTTGSRIDGYLRVGVRGGGCGGFNYDLDVVAGKPDARDLVWKQDEPEVHPGVPYSFSSAVDPISAQYLRGVTIDFVKAGLRSGFRFTNPMAKATCGCGRSFSG